MKNSMLKQKTPLRAKTGLKTYSTLKAKSQLKAKKSLTDSYAEKIKSGEKKAKSYQKAYKPKYKYISVFTNDLDTCIITGATKASGAAIEIHHIFGASRKELSEKYGFIIPLREDWHTVTNYSIHQDRELDLYWKRKCQEVYLNCYGTKEQFIEEFGKFW